MLLNGHSVPDTLAALADIERQLGIAAPPDGRRRYRRIGRWLAEDGLVIAELRARLAPRRPERPGIPEFDRLRPGALLRKRLLTRGLDAPVGASAILFKNNVRAFYPGREPCTVKLLGHARSLDGFRTDVETRRLIGDSRTLDVPHVRHAALDAAAPFLSEELIEGRSAQRPEDAGRVLDEAVPRLWRMYRHFGLSPERLGDHFDLDATATILEQARLPAGDWASEERCRIALAQRMRALRRAADEPVLVSLGHGDLSPGNMIVSGRGRLFVVDWELARRMPALWDFRKLLLRVPGCFPRLAAQLGGEPAGRLRDQCLIVAGAQIAGLFDRRARGDRNLTERRFVRVLRGDFAGAARLLADGDR